MTNYKLTYFACKALGEPIRLMLIYAGVPFEDHQIPLDKYQDVKNYGFGKVPVLYVDGKQLTQSITIARYLAKKFDMIPKDEFAAARCDEIVDIATELRLEFRSFITEPDQLKKLQLKANLVDTVFPKYYPILNQLVTETQGQFIAGDGLKNLSWADLFLANWLEIWSDTVITSQFYSSFPGLQNLEKSVFDIPVIAEYVKSRPKTPF